ILYSVEFAEVERLMRQGQWVEVGRLLADTARRLEGAGADFLVLGTNTMHRVAEAIEGAVGIPLLHIADATAEAVRAAGIRRVGLLGTRPTMEDGFYRGRLVARHGLDVLVPDEGDREVLHRIIFDELCLGQTRDASREAFRRIMADLVARGAEGIILGCTEIGLLVSEGDAAVPLFDTTVLHARAAVAAALR
ncbi:MAG: aspartate/glutamate racemase family protein, partial [Chloroflexota bacterium]